MDFDYQIIRSDRKTVSIQITPAGDVQVRCPRRFPEAKIREFVSSKEKWIRKHLTKNERLPRFSQEEIHQMAEQVRCLIAERVAYFAPLVGVTYGRITIRNQRSRWGSCSSKGNLNFNCVLMLTPEWVRDYIVIHELCHLKNMDHSPAFWAEVARLCPQWKAAKAWLKANSAATIGRL